MPLARLMMIASPSMTFAATSCSFRRRRLCGVNMHILLFENITRRAKRPPFILRAVREQVSRGLLLGDSSLERPESTRRVGKREMAAGQKRLLFLIFSHG